jgi:hypothetical protein
LHHNSRFQRKERKEVLKPLFADEMEEGHGGVFLMVKRKPVPFSISMLFWQAGS